jgi:hypothetical protein
MNNALTNAFPSQPIRDQFGQIVFPVNGISKFEYFALEIYKVIYNRHRKEYYEDEPDGNLKDEIIMEIAINDAIDFLELLEKHTKALQNDQNDKLAIVQP